MMAPVTVDEIVDFYSHMREELDLDQLLPEGVRRTRGVGTMRGSGGSGTFSPQLMSPGPRKQGSGKIKKDAMTSSQDMPVDVEGGLHNSKKRKREEQAAEAAEPPAKIARVSDSEPEPDSAPASTSPQPQSQPPTKGSSSNTATSSASTAVLAPVESSLRKLSEAPPELKLDIERYPRSASSRLCSS